MALLTTPLALPPLVLMYHGVDLVPAADDPDNLFVPVDALARHLDRLLERGFTVIDEDTYVEGLHGARLPRRSVLLTFDDGLVSVLDKAAPLLAERSAPAVCYVSAGLLGRGPVAPGQPQTALLDAEQVHDLGSYGVTVGCHGWDHTSMRQLPEDELERATTQARRCLRDITGLAPRTFAYPFGHHDQRARAAVRRAGYACAFATHDGRGRYAVPRVDVNATDTDRSFDLKITRGYHLARQVASRAPGVRRRLHDLVGRAERE